MAEGLRRTETFPAGQQESQAEPIRIGDREYQLGDNVKVKITRDAEGKPIGMFDNADPEAGWTFAGIRENGTLRLRSPKGEKIAITKERFIEWQKETTTGESRKEVAEKPYETPAAAPFSQRELRKIERDEQRGQAA